MTGNNLQLRRLLILLAGYVIIPSVILYSAFRYGADQNMTGLLHMPFFRFFGFLLLFWLVFLMRLCTPLWKKEKAVMAVLIAAALLVPYTEADAAVSSLHIALSYGGLVMMNVILFRIGWDDVILRNIYLCVSAFCFFMSAGALQVTMLSEAVYACAVFILLTKKGTSL